MPGSGWLRWYFSLERIESGDWDIDVYIGLTIVAITGVITFWWILSA